MARTGPASLSGGMNWRRRVGRNNQLSSASLESALLWADVQEDHCCLPPARAHLWAPLCARHPVVVVEVAAVWRESSWPSPGVTEDGYVQPSLCRFASLASSVVTIAIACHLPALPLPCPYSQTEQCQLEGFPLSNLFPQFSLLSLSVNPSWRNAAGVAEHHPQHQHKPLQPVPSSHQSDVLQTIWWKQTFLLILHVLLGECLHTGISLWIRWARHSTVFEVCH